jgi:hypothetical protein
MTRRTHSGVAAYRCGHAHRPPERIEDRVYHRRQHPLQRLADAVLQLKLNSNLVLYLKYYREFRSCNDTTAGIGSFSSLSFGICPMKTRGLDRRRLMVGACACCATGAVDSLRFVASAEPIAATPARPIHLQLDAAARAIVGITPPDQNPAHAPVNHSPLFKVDEAGLVTGLRSLLHVVADYTNSGPI